MKKHFLTYLLVFIGIMFMLLLCTQDKKLTVHAGDLRFRTTDDAELFFKNVRQLYYDVEEIEQAGMRVYRKRDRYLGNDHPVLNLAIVHSWRNDEAYMIVEPNELLRQEDTLRFEITDTSGVAVEHVYTINTKEDQLRMATALYNLNDEQRNIQVRVGEALYDFPVTEDEKETFRVTMYDYFRLTGVF